MLNEYRVTWTIDVTAETPQEAAAEALNDQRNPESTATVFDVTDEAGRTVQVDLLIPARLEYLRGEIDAERISQSGVIELQSLAEHIDPGDVHLLEWAGVPEFPES